MFRRECLFFLELMGVGGNISVDHGQNPEKIQAAGNDVLLLKPTVKRGTDNFFLSERNRLSYRLKNFEIIGLVTKTKSGKNVVVRLTGLGGDFNLTGIFF